MLARASSLFLLRACCQLFPRSLHFVHCTVLVSYPKMLLGLPRAFRCACFRCFYLWCSLWFFTFWNFGGSCCDWVRKQGSSAATNSRRFKHRAYLPKAANNMIDIAVMCQIIAGTSYTEVSLMARAISHFVYAPPAEGGFLYLTHSKWESLKEGHMRFLRPAFVFIHSEEVFIFAQSSHPVHTHSKQKNNWPTKSKTKRKCLSDEPNVYESRGSSILPLSDPGKIDFHSSSIKSF